MENVLVVARGLGKSYPQVFRSRDRLRALWRLLRGVPDGNATAVLRDINLEVRRGESLGLIGENGAGKSTLLKLLTGVLTPTHGSVSVHGRVGALLELGAGFHPEYSGRDNVAMAAALYGLSAQEMRERFDQIINFADIGHYIDEPVKHYSSGMIVRLGFAVVAALRPDLLITDEILAVGDESFQKKCVRWMEEYLDAGGTLILVSHSMYHVQKLCRRACWIRQGQVAAYGDVFEVTQAYLAYHEAKLAPQTVRDPGAARSRAEFELIDLSLNGISQQTAVLLEFNACLLVHVAIRSRDGRVPVVVVGIARVDGTPVYGVSTEMDGVEPLPDGAGGFSVEVEFRGLSLLPGAYVIKAHPLDPEGVRLFDTMERPLTIRGNSREFGLVRLDHTWSAVAPVAGTLRRGVSAT